MEKRNRLQQKRLTYPQFQLKLQAIFLIHRPQ